MGNAVGPATGRPHWTVAPAVTVASLKPRARAKKRETRLGALPGFLRPGGHFDGAGRFVQDEVRNVACPVASVAVGEAAGEGGGGGTVGVVDVPGAFLRDGEGCGVGSVAELGPLGVKHADVDRQGGEAQQGHHEDRDEDADGAALAVRRVCLPSRRTA